MMAKMLSTLLDHYTGPDVEISGITLDSRAVKPGYVFIAVPGVKVDGRDFIADAIASGAASIVVPAGTTVEGEAVLIAHDNPRHAAAVMAARFYGRQPEIVTAVTGTNGKTSTAHFTQQLWAGLNLPSASLGTIGVRGTHFNRDGSMTTPDPVSLMAIMAEMADAGVTHLAMEASSHGLDQNRLDGMRVSAAGFTNLTRDHLDYHGDMQTYLAAKARLFSSVLCDDGTAVLNADDEAFVALADICKSRGLRTWSYGQKAQDIILKSRNLRPDGQDLQISVLGRDYTVALPLVGQFQAMNALCALGLALAEDVSRIDDLVDGLSRLQGAPGRLQNIPGHPKGAAVYVDYAHTPDALVNVLQSLRPHTTGRLVCLFGCGGNRDKGKRPVMGNIAADLADHVIVTDDNPRFEQADVIRDEIMAGIKTNDAENIGDRRAAIRHAIGMLKDGDVLVIAGKGHEQGQIIGNRVDPFDDVEEATTAILNIGLGEA